MSDENKKDVETQEPNTEEDKTSENENDPKTEDVSSLVAQKNRWREKTEKLQAELAALKLEPETTSKPRADVKPVDSGDMAKRMDALEAGQAGHHPKVVEKAIIFAAGQGTTLTKALEDPTIKAYANVIASEKAADEATPASGRSPKLKPEKPVTEMGLDEHKDFWKTATGN